MRGTGLFILRRHHPDVIAEAAGDIFGDGETRRMDAIVIGNQDAHGCGLKPESYFPQCNFLGLPGARNKLMEIRISNSPWASLTRPSRATDRCLWPRMAGSRPAMEEIDF